MSSGIPQIAAHLKRILSRTGVPGKGELPQHLVDGASERADASLSYEKCCVCRHRDAPFPRICIERMTIERLTLWM